MIIVNDLKPGTTFEYEKNLFVVLDVDCNKTAMRQMIVKVKVKNLRTGVINEISFTGGDKVEQAPIDKKKMQYLYNDGDLYYFMDMESYEQIPLNADKLSENFKYVKEEMICTIKSYKGNVFSVEPPMFVELEIIDAEPGVKGDTATGTTKNATVETGAVVRVPLFINQGERIRIDTRTGEYLERA